MEGKELKVENITNSFKMFCSKGKLSRVAVRGYEGKNKFLKYGKSCLHITFIKKILVEWMIGCMVTRQTQRLAELTSG